MARGRPLSQVEVETDLMEEVEHLEALTNGGHSPKSDADLLGYDDICDLAADAEADWKITEANTLIALAAKKTEGRGEPEYLRRARVLQAHGDLYRSYKKAGAVKESRKEAMTTSRNRLDAVRTIAANIRTQT